MNRLIQVLCVLMIFLGTPNARADSKSETLNVVQAWIGALNRSDVNEIVGTFDANASFFGTSSKTLVTNSAGIRQYFENVYTQLSPLSVELGEYVINELSPDSAVLSGYDKWKVTIDGKQVERVGRLSIAVARKDGQWHMVSFHRSSMPK